MQREGAKAIIVKSLEKNAEAKYSQYLPRMWRNHPNLKQGKRTCLHLLRHNTDNPRIIAHKNYLFAESFSEGNKISAARN
jgi:hypothetical protein